MLKTLCLALLVAACGGKQSSNTSSAGGAPPAAQDTTSDHIEKDAGEPAMTPEPTTPGTGSAMSPDK